MMSLRISAVLGLAMALQACAIPAQLPPQNDIAARIYTDLARYYWQHGYIDLATDRAHLALLHTPDFAPAQQLLQQIQTDID